jgi:subtilisin family serine protease
MNMQRRVRPLFGLFFLIGSLAGMLLAPVSARTPSATPSTTLSANPAALAATVALGASQTATLTIHHADSSALQPLVFEAFDPEPAPLPHLDASTVVPLPVQLTKVDPILSAQARIAADRPTDVLVFLADQPDLKAAYTISDWNARGTYVVETLKAHAARSQAALRADLDALGVAYTPLWVVNALLVQATAAEINTLAARPDIALLRANRVATWLPNPDQAQAELTTTLEQFASCTADANHVCWNVRAVGADRVWNEFGVRGSGITVASIDSGVQFTHPALVGQYRGTRPSGGFDHNHNWYDAVRREPAPVDAGFHGTHTLGTIAARGSGAQNPAVGVAPDVRWITARACESTRCDETSLILAAQWMLAPTNLTGMNPRPDLRPHIVNNSWAAGQGDANWYAGYVAAWRAAGIFPVFAAGNTGNLTQCGTIQSPGDYRDVVGVGSAERNGQLSSFSSIGPTVDGRVKPDLIAPGSDVISTVPNQFGSYLALRGTSMATPHVSGAVALLWAANPALIGDYTATLAALTATARPVPLDERFATAAFADCSPALAPNSLVGYGALDVHAAVAQTRVDVPWLRLSSLQPPTLAANGSATLTVTFDARAVPGPGTYTARVLVYASLTSAPLIVPVTLSVPSDPAHVTIQGSITRLSDATGLQGRVTVEDGATVTTDAAGRYTLILAPAATPITLTASAPAYSTQQVQISAEPGAQLTRDFRLDRDAPRLSVADPLRTSTLDFAQTQTLAFTLDNSGSQPLSYTVSLPADNFGIWRSDEPDGPAYAWITPPATATSLTLSDDSASAAIPIGFDFPFGAAHHDQVWISSNGFLAFEPLPAIQASFIPSCFPISETFGGVIAPLRLDLNPAQGGTISYARIPEGFLITWNDVPLFGAPLRRFSFQALLHPDGRVRMNYRDVANVQAADRASVGLQMEGYTQSLGCDREIMLRNQLSIELRPQALSTSWASLAERTAQIAAGAQTTLPLEVRWTRPLPTAEPVSARVAVRSNDPDQPISWLTVRLNSTSAPHEAYLLIVR